MSELVVGDNAFIDEAFAHGEDCTVGPYAFVGPNCVFGDGVKIDARATVLAPESSAGSKQTLTVQTGASIGASAIVCGAEVIGRGARIEPGAVVTGNVPPNAVVAGNPAHVTGYVSPPAGGNRGRPVEIVHAPREPETLHLPSGASVTRFPEVVDLRGKLTFGDIDGLLPFSVNRFFLVYGVPSQEIRGEHAHRSCHQMIIAVSGAVSVLTDNSIEREEVRLDEPTVGLHLPPMVWGVQFRHTSDAVLLVLASECYDNDDYIRDYDEFIQETRCSQ